MKVVYREQADKDGRHYIHDAVMKRDELLRETTVNAATLELEIDEISANAALCRRLTFTRWRRDAGGKPKYSVIGGVVSEDIGWVEWIDPEDGTEPPPVIEPRQYKAATVEVDTAKARLKEPSANQTLTAADEKEA